MYNDNCSISFTKMDYIKELYSDIRSQSYSLGLAYHTSTRLFVSFPLNSPTPPVWRSVTIGLLVRTHPLTRTWGQPNLTENEVSPLDNNDGPVVDKREEDYSRRAERRPLGKKGWKTDTDLLPRLEDTDWGPYPRIRSRSVNQSRWENRCPQWSLCLCTAGSWVIVS